MKLLTLETSVTPGSIATLKLDEGEHPSTAIYPLPESGRTAVILAPTLASALQQVGWNAQELSAVAVTQGPGSFTGLRIGVTTAKALAYAAGCPVVPISTLEVLAQQFFDTGGQTERLWCIMDAQRQELFAQPFDSSGPVGQQVIISAETWLANLKPGDAVIGPILKRLQNQLPSEVTAADPAIWQPQATTVAKLAAIAFQEGKTTTPFELVPDYGRLSAAEEKANLSG